MRTRLIAAGLVGLSIVYLALFVPRGWIPHDEGMIGQSAERVLNGEMPHVDYEEPYTGGLSWLHALVFRFAGVDLIYPRWLLLAGAVVAQVLVYLILSRYVRPLGAAMGAWLALGWSFPNYFAALPSWWVLICALACVWAFLRFVETGSLRYAAAAGLAAGFSILIKQTGLYVLVALVMALLYDGDVNERERSAWWPGRLVCASVAVAGVALALLILSARLSLSDLLYLFLPILVCSRLLLASDGRAASRQSWDALLPAGAAVCAAALPLLFFVAPYVVDQQVGALINGLFILPQKRMQFASLELPEAHWLLAGVPLLAILMPLPARLRISALETRPAVVVMWLAGLAVLVTSLSAFTSYQVIWQAARSCSAILPIAVCSLVMSGRVHDRMQRRNLFGIATFLAWASLVQVPFSAPIYFCYVTPLAVIAAVAVAANTTSLHRPALAVSAAVLLAFALVSMNRGYVYNLGGVHRLFTFDEPLGLKRASLRVSTADAVTYRRVTTLIASHIGDGQLVAGPDAPEVYFLTGRFSPSGTLFDFFTDQVSAEGGLNDLPGLPGASVVVLNHGRRFSLGPSAHLAAKVRRMFPHSEGVGTLEVRWR
jgi:Dolichyl-phosphate-mannose-protein mannosyltransferase